MNAIEHSLARKIVDKVYTHISQLSDDERAILFVMSQSELAGANSYGELRIGSLGIAAMLEYESRLKKEENERARQEAKDRAEHAQAVEDKKKDRRHDFLVAAFGGIVTLLVEHFGDIMHFLQKLVDIVFFH